MTVLTDPFAYAFFTRALAAGVLVGAMCGAIGVFIVLRRMSYIGHGLSHSVLGGVAVGLAFGVNLYIGAALATVLSGLLIDRISRRKGLYADAAIGIVTTAMFALGVAVISVLRVGRVNTESLLFGNVLGVGRGDLVLALSVAVVFTVLMFLFYKPLLFVTFDPHVAAAQGIRAGFTEALFHLLTAAVVIVSVRVLGVLLIAAAVVVPAALARLVTGSFGRMLVLSTLVGAMSALVGLYVSYYARVPSGATIVLVAVAAFGFVAVVTAAIARSRLSMARKTHGAT